MSTAETLTLHGDRFWISPFFFSCFVGLREKGIAFDVATVALEERAHLQPGYRDRSITARVPALAHGGFWLAESSAIVEYLEEAFPPPRHPALLPRDLRARARARQVLSWLRSDLQPLREERPTTTMFYEPAHSPLSRAGAAAAEKLLRVAGQLLEDEAMTTEWSIAHADLAFMLHRLILNDHPVPPRIREFAEAQWRRPSVQAFVGHERAPYVPY
jgi:glutathione S-transferase